MSKPVKTRGDLKRTLRLFNRFTKGERNTFGAALALLVLEAATTVLEVWPIERLVRFFRTGEPIGFFGLGPDLLSTSLFLGSAVVGIAILNSLGDSGSEIYLARGGRQLGYRLRVGLYGHLQKLSLAFHGRSRTGDMVTRLTGDVRDIEEFITKSFSDIAGSVLIIGGTVIYLMRGSWEFAAIALATVPLMALVSNGFARRVKEAAKAHKAQEAELANSAQEMLTSIRVIQTYGRAGFEQDRFAGKSETTKRAALYAAYVEAGFGFSFAVLQAVCVAIVIGVGIHFVDNGNLTAEEVVAFVYLLREMFKPTKRVIKQWNELAKIYASADRIQEVLDREPTVADSPDAVEAPPFRGDIEFRDVSFAYQTDSDDATEGVEIRLALDGVNLRVQPGEVVALVGYSGAGKSTIAQLLPRLYDPHAGSITIDGVDIRSVTLESLRAQIGMVLQDSILFTGTVADNIAYGRPEATRDEIVQAAKLANAHDFIEAMPGGYDAMLSERAANLSGGQRQRIAIARALVRDSPILILDEPTTGLDAESTDLVHEALTHLMRGKSTLIISHDLNLIRDADRIVAMAKGRLRESGTHDELLRTEGLYASLYHRQFGADGAGTVPAASPVPEPLLFTEDEDDDDGASRQVFATMVIQALPRPASSQAFQTLSRAPRPPTEDDIPPPPPPPAPPAVEAPPRTGTETIVRSEPRREPSSDHDGGDDDREIFTTTSMAALRLSNPPPGLRPPVAATGADADETDAAPDEADEPAPSGPPGTRLRDELDARRSPALAEELPGLATALDPDAMRDVLQEALFGRGRARHDVVAVAVRDPQWLPGEGAVMRYRLELRERASGDAWTAMVGARVLLDQGSCVALLYEHLAPLAGAAGDRPYLARFAAPVAVVDHLRLVLHAFPIDPEMPTLLQASDPAVVGQLVGAPEVHVEVAEYSRAARCSLRYKVAGRPAVYGKVLPVADGDRAAAALSALGSQLAGVVAVPAVLRWDRERCLLLAREVAGRPAVQEALDAGDLGPSLDALLVTAGSVASRVHTTSAPSLPERHVAETLTMLGPSLEPVARVAPGLGAHLLAWLEVLLARADDGDPGPTVASHGDLRPPQVLLAGDDAGLVDFDLACRTEAAADAGRFLAHLTLDATRAGASPDVVARLRAAFLRGAGTIDASRLALHESLTLLEVAAGAWRSFDPARAALALDVLGEPDGGPSPS